MRAPAARRPQKARPVNFVAPTAGWIANRALAASGGAPGAAILDNFFPQPTGVILRRGKAARYSIGFERVRSLFRYISGAQAKLFASTSGDIIDVSASTVGATVHGGTNGDWHVQQFTTTAGTFLIGVNGTDPAFLYDGSTFAASTITFPSGEVLDTSDLAYVWSYAERLWFIQRDSMSAWYLPVGQIGGELTEYPLTGVFQRGGALLWGQSWSLATGGAGGLSDQCVFVSTEGEVAAFQGTNPGSASSWARVGLYRIGKPLGRKAFVRAGGDLVVATSVGMVALGTAARTDFAALGAAAISYPIVEAWNDAVQFRGMDDWRCEIWAEGGMMLIVPPPDDNGDTTLFVANVNTGAWCRFTNWRVASIETFNGQLHFGDHHGNLWIGNATGSDDGAPYTGVCVPLFTDLGAPANRKIARSARLVKRSAHLCREKLTAMFDFSERTPPAPDAPAVVNENLWGSAVWGEATWGREAGNLVTSEWKSLGGSGQDVSVCVQITSNSLAALDAELLRVDATFETAGMIS